MLSQEQKQLLTETVARYYETLNAETASYLKSRGISKEVAATFLLGTVTDPVAGHEHGIGCLSIPYITGSGVVGIKFRKIDGTNPKYIWPTGQKIGMFNVEDLKIDRLEKRVYRKKTEITLGPTEYRLIEFFLTNPKRVFTRDQILENVWPNNINVETRTIDVHIRRLRKSINLPNCKELIRTVRSSGYSLI